MATVSYRFGEFHLDPAGREFRRGDEEVVLPLKVFDCMVYLVENRDRAVGRDELIEAVWGDRHLSDSVLGQTVLLARKALEDTGEEQHIIKTVRGFGYRWVAPVEPGPMPADVESTRHSAAARDRAGSPRLWMVPAILVAAAVGVLAVSTAHLRRGSEPGSPGIGSSPSKAGEIALLLPVKVEPREGDAWIRLGLMDLIADRLHTAGQAMVPSDTVIALLGGAGEFPSPDDVQRLAAATGARLVLEARAEVNGTRWTVSLHSLLGAQPPITAVGEAHDVLAAARACADKMSVALGLTPNPDPNGDRELQMLLQRIRAAALAQQTDLARRLIDAAPPRLRRHPEIRYHRGAIEISGNRLDAVRAYLQPLLEQTPAERDPHLRARILNCLAAAHARQGDWRAAEPLMQEAARLFSESASPTGLEALRTRGTIYSNLGAAVLERRDVESAREQFAQARRIFQSIGDVQKLALIDLQLGALEGNTERPGEAVHYFEAAAERFAAVHDAGSELHARAYVMAGHLELLDPRAAAAVEPHVRELLEQVDDPMLAAIGKLALVDFFDSIGRTQAARAGLEELAAATEAQDGLYTLRMETLVRTAEDALRDGDGERAAADASRVVERLSAARSGRDDATLARAGLIVVRAQLLRGDLDAAQAASAALAGLAGRSSLHSLKVDAALAQAALEVARGSRDTAAAKFELALAEADAGRVPRHLLQIAESYVPWLLAEGDEAGLERALAVADRVGRHADRHYGVALLQLRVYHAAGPPSAWRAALSRARSLAGERLLPAELLTPSPPPSPSGRREAV